MGKVKLCVYTICFLSLVIFYIAYFRHNEGLEWLCLGAFGTSGVLVAIMNPINNDEDDYFEEDEE